MSGLSVGLAITTVPPLLSHIAITSPSSSLSTKRGLIGTLNQLGIVLGILSAQLVGLGATGMKGDRNGGWRWVVVVSGIVAVAQLGVGMLLQPHIKLRLKGNPDEPRSAAPSRDDETEGGYCLISRRKFIHECGPNTAEPLLSPSGTKSVSRPSSISEILANPSIRPQALLVAFILAAQQFSGIK